MDRNRKLTPSWCLQNQREISPGLLSPTPQPSQKDLPALPNLYHSPIPHLPLNIIQAELKKSMPQGRLVPGPSVDSESPSDVLRRTLSVRSVVSTPSSFADGELEYPVIGLVSCGAVFEVPGLDLAVKKGQDTASMWKDFLLTNRVYNTIADTREVLQDAFPDRTLPKAPQCRVLFLSPTPKSTSKRPLIDSLSRIGRLGRYFQLTASFSSPNQFERL